LYKLYQLKLVLNRYQNYKFNDSYEVCLNEELQFYLYVFRAEINIVIMLFKNIKKERVEFRLEVFFDPSCKVSELLILPFYPRRFGWFSYCGIFSCCPFRVHVFLSQLPRPSRRKKICNPDIFNNQKVCIGITLTVWSWLSSRLTSLCCQ